MHLLLTQPVGIVKLMPYYLRPILIGGQALFRVVQTGEVGSSSGDGVHLIELEHSQNDKI